MESLFITMMFLFAHSVTTEPSGCSSSTGSSSQPNCNTTLFDSINASVCYMKYQGEWSANVTCNTNTASNYTIKCNKNTSRWESSPADLCHSPDTSPPPPAPSTKTSPRMTNTTKTSLQSSEPTRDSTTVLDHETSMSESTEMPSHSATTASATGTSGTTIVESTRQTEQTNTIDNTSLSTRKSPVISDDNGSVVVPVVSVFVVVVIALAAVIVFLLWRYRRIKQKKAMGDYSGTSISNGGYEDDHGLDRHISLLDMRPDNSVDSGYAEISPANINVEESPGNVYQTIDNLTEDKTECDSGYGHLRIQTTTLIDNNYSHVAVDPNGKPSSDATYAHTGNPLNAQELKDDGENETTYNHLEKNARNPQGTQQPLQNEEKEVFDDVEAEYNHAKAGHLALQTDNKGDTYSHLNQLRQRPQVNQQNESVFLTQGSKPQTYRTTPQKLDFDNDVGRNTFPEYAKCAKKLNERQTPKEVGRDGYETPAGTANIYFTLEPESKLADTDVLFQMTNETFEDSESEESPNHQYFILDKIATDTDT